MTNKKTILCCTKGAKFSYSFNADIFSDQAVDEFSRTKQGSTQVQ